MNVEMIPTPESSQLTAFGYDSASGVLTISFKSTGTTYEYYQVPPNVFEELKAAESKGSYFIKNIKRASYKYRRL